MKTVAGLVFGIFLTLNATAAVRYVDIGSTNPVSPYASWAYAARTIQDAVDVASAGDQVVVNDGTYQSGGRAVQGSAGNRVALTKAVTVTSVNGPAATTIIGDAYPHYMYGCRCAYLVAGATLSGFTLSNGKIGLGPDQANYWGGGVWATAASAVVSNCVITGNSIATAGVGGGVYGGTFVNCIISSNATPRKDTYTPGGGGAESSTLINCLVTGNSSDGYGGGANRCKLINCTVVANYGAAAGGASICDASNSIVYFNTCNSYYGSYSNYDIVPGIVGSFAYSCTAPDPGGVQNLAQDPLFVDPAGGDFHLQTNSPCINAGCNAPVSTSADLDGKLRITGATVDLGAYEFQKPASLISYSWLQQYGLATDGSADFADPDADGLNHWQEWLAGTDPTNAQSVLKLLRPSADGSGINVSWQSVTNRTYYLQRSTNLTGALGFISIQSNCVGQAGITTFKDTSATSADPYFYRVGVQ